MKRNKEYITIPITDPRVTPIWIKTVERFLDEFAKCKSNPDYLLNKSYFKTTR